MNVWVTGAGGMLGRAVMDQLARWAVPHAGTGRELDVSDPDAVAAFVSRRVPSHIVNCAAFTAVDEAEAAEARAQRVNARGPEVLGTAAAGIGARVLHYSTDYVFDGEAARPYGEDDRPAPLSAYGRSKLDGERRLLAACPSSHVVRTSWLFGSGGTSFVAKMLGLMAEREQLRVVDDQLGRPTYALDLAEASLSLAGLGPSAVSADFGLYHFANAGAVSWHGFATAILDAARRRGLDPVTRTIEAVRTGASPGRATRPRASVLDTGRIEGVLGRSPRPWSEALEACLDRRAKEPG